VFDGVNSKTDFASSISAGGAAGDEAGGSRSTSHSTSYTTKFNSVYEELDQSLSTIVSESGEFSISTNTGTITVYDTPLVQKRVDKFIQKMNAIINKRVMVKTQVLEVRADDTGNYGIDWNAVYSGSSRLGFDLKSLASTGDISGNLNFGLIDGNSNWSGSKAAISALNEVADTSLVTSTTSMTRNGQPVPVQIVDSKGFLKKLEKTTGEDGDSYTMETDKIESGFSMSILPRITSDGKVSMQMAIDLSELNGFDKFEFSDNVAMTPDVSRKNFTQNVSVRNGQTIMLSGFERTVDESKVKSMAGESSWLLGGSKEGGQRKIMTIIMMTPYVMSN
jgi:type IVB pilus formation R64 PilN family outer membrane protein